jgi:TRAP-type C4-dicarboxylate transport system substrate-binding protein
MIYGVWKTTVSRRPITVAVLAFFSIVLPVWPPLAAAATWHMATAYPVTSFHTMNLEKFAKDVKTATAGRLEIKVHSAGSLFKHPEIKTSVRSGHVQIGEFLLSQLANESPLFHVDSLPFLATNYDDAAVLWDVTKPRVQRHLGAEGLTVLFAVPWPPQALYTRKEVEKVEHLHGVKLRTYNVAQERLAALVGAVPTQVEVTDIPQAFSTGRIDAMITSPSTAVSARAWEFLTHSYHTRAWLPKNVVVVNTRALRALGEDDREVVLAAAAAAEQRGWAMSRKETAEKLLALKANGLNMHDPSAELTAGLRDLGQIMAEEWAAEAGAEGAAIMAEYRALQGAR